MATCGSAQWELNQSVLKAVDMPCYAKTGACRAAYLSITAFENESDDIRPGDVVTDDFQKRQC